MNPFLERAGWKDPRPLASDASARRYSRVQKGDQTAILMEGATPDEFRQFIKIAKWLRSCDLSAPAILEADEEKCVMLIEDFGDLSFKKAAEQGADEYDLYALAADILAALTHKDAHRLDLPDYYASNVHKGRRRVIDWYAPLALGRKNPETLAAEYLAVWEEIEYRLPHPHMGFVHIDYHAENLMYLPDRTGLRRCGLLDFQGAMYGPALYDLANLLEDARRDVPPEIRAEILATLDDDIDRGWYRILATQFHCRVIGQFIKFAVQGGNSAYLPHIPRLQNYIREALDDPLLAPLKRFFAAQGLDFSVPLDLSNLARAPGFIAPDAF